MSAYIVFTREATTDSTELQRYEALVRGTLTGHTPTLLAAYGTERVLEGPRSEGTVIMAFPSMQAASAWYDSPAYTEVREHRFKGAIYRAVLVQGVQADGS
jgi:uncharacterized protein (DUF1330 family)